MAVQFAAAVITYLKEHERLDVVVCGYLSIKIVFKTSFSINVSRSFACADFIYLDAPSSRKRVGYKV